MKNLVTTLHAQHGITFSVLAPHEQDLSKRENQPGIEVRRFQYFWPARFQKFAYGAGIPQNFAASSLAKVQAVPFVVSFLLKSIPPARKCDVIHANWLETGWLGCLVARLCRKPLVTTVHSVSSSPKFRYFYKNALRGSDYVLFNSSFTESIAREFATPAAGEVLFQGVDTHKFEKERTGLYRQWLGVNEQDILISTVGRLIPWKGQINLIRALKEGSPHLNNVHIAIAGEGPERERLLKACREARLENRVHLLGKIQTEEVPSLLADSDLYVNPAVVDEQGRTESMGIAVCEAMAAGLPCIVSRVGGLPDLVCEGETGRLVPPGDIRALTKVVVDLCSNPDRRGKMGKVAREQAQQVFAWETIAERTADIYTKLVQNQFGEAHKNTADQ